ncbi:hypothetical protein DITRI_Ditri08aG0085000 [Diplodiscus trichospermus]
MYVGFSGSTGLLTASHSVHGWSFTIGGRAQDLDQRKLPFLKTRSNEVVHRKGFAVGMTFASMTLVFLVIIGAIHIIRRIREGGEILEDWEIEYGAWRFRYSELFSTARGFGEKNLVGSGRHWSLVHLYGWCRKQDELLLVYDYFPNGSLDKLLYVDGCNQRVVHRDVKPSKVLIDEDLNAKLGDFGLPRTCEHDMNPQTTNIVGTLRYLAPELTRTGKATRSTDIYGYGTLMLEVACRRRPIEPQNNAQELLQVDWIRELHSRGEITRAIDPTLGNYHSGEAELVLTLGLLCCHPHPDYRPTMRRVVQYLMGDAILPPLPRNIHMEVPMTTAEESESFADDSDPSSHRMTSSQSNSSTSSDKKLSTAYNTRVTF